MELKKVNKKDPVILQVLPSMEMGGVERGVVDVSKAIVKAGGKSIVISSGGKLVNEILISKGQHITLPVHSKNPFIIYRNIKKIRNIIIENDVNIVHVRSRAPAWSCYYAVKGTNAKLITIFHAAYGLNCKLKRKYNAIMTKGEVVIAISNFIKGHILKNYEIDKSKLKVVIRGTDLNKFNIKDINNERLEKVINDWHISEEYENLVLCPGRLSKIKGQETLIKAAKILTEKGKNKIAYVFLGSDQGRTEYSNMLLEKIKENKLEDKFYMINRCDDMPAAYAYADVVVSLSNVEEGFGRIPTESQAMGKPIIATNLGGHLETIEDGQTGTLIDVDDAKALAENIEKYLNYSDRQKVVYANKVIKSVQEKFSTDIMFKQLFNIYNSLL